MLCMVKTELWKCKRYHMIWAGVLLMMLSVLLTVFTTTAINDTEWTFSFFAEQVIKNNVTTIFPMCIALLAGYMIAREDNDDTLKNILTVPVSYRRLLLGKLTACAFLAVFLGVMSAVFTVAANLLLGFPGLDMQAAVRTFVQIIVNCLFLYLAVTPVIAACARMQNGHMIGAVIAFVYGYGGMFAAGNQTIAALYPVTASLGMIRYRSYDPAVHWNGFFCFFSLAAAFLVSVVLVCTMRGGAPVKAAKKEKKAIVKKGW